MTEIPHNNPISMPPEKPEASDNDSYAAILIGVDPTNLDAEGLESLVDLHPDAQEAMAALSYARRHVSKESLGDLTFQVQRTRSRVAGQILGHLGISLESEKDKALRLETERQEKVKAISDKLTGDENEDQLMRLFGLTDEDGRLSELSMDSPLFTLETKFAFKKYMRYVAQYQAMESAGAVTGSVVKGSSEASNLRGEAHNSVALLVANNIGLDFDSARRIVAKMRDTLVPGSGEKASYAELLRGQKLVERYNGDASVMTREMLSGLLPDDHH